jgi:hypothetical protein
MKYRVFCETEGKHVITETLLIREECPNDSGHVVTSGSLVITSEGCCTKDYKKQRAELQNYVLTTGFENLPQEEKEIASAHFVVEKADRDTVHSLDTQIQHGLKFHKRSVCSRRRREQRCVVELYNRLDKADVDEIISETSSLIDNYVYRGREGTEVGDPEGIYDYMQAVSGTSFESTGLAAKNLVPYEMTLSGLVIKVMDILKNGNY